MLEAGSEGTEDGMDREERFLSRLRERLALITPDQRTPHPGARPRIATAGGRPHGDEQPPAALADRFAAEWRGVGGECYPVSRDDIAAAIARLVEEAGGGPVLRSADPRWDDIGLDASLKEKNIPVMQWGGPGAEGDSGTPRADRAGAAAARVGLTWPLGASAETGTILERASTTNGRLVSLLPPVHIAVLEVERIYPHRSALFQALRETAPDFRGMALVTGPSRTGDIQNDLTVGVHGPKRAIVLLVGAG